MIARVLLLTLPLAGCIVGTRTGDLDEGRLLVDADCNENRVRVELDLDRDRSRDDVSITK